MIKAVLSRGVLYSIGIVINRIVPEKLFRFRIFRVFDLHCPDDDRQSDSSSASPLEFRWCQSDEDFHAAQQLTYFQSSSELDVDRLAACLALDAAEGGAANEPIGGVWRAVEWFDEEELGLRLPLIADQAWIFAAYVSRSHRGRGTYRRLLSHVLQNDAQSQYFAAINPTNRKSIAAHAAFIRSTAGTCVAMRIFQSRGLLGRRQTEC